jgi:hypothetical protein
MILPSEVRTKRRILRTTQEALRFIEIELAEEMKMQPRWTFARELLLEAERTEKLRDLRCAYRQLKQAIQNDRLAGS